MSVLVERRLATGRGGNEQAIHRPAREQVDECAPSTAAIVLDVAVRDDRESRQRRWCVQRNRSRHASTISSKIVPSGIVIVHPGKCASIFRRSL